MIKLHSNQFAEMKTGEIIKNKNRQTRNKKINLTAIEPNLIQVHQILKIENTNTLQGISIKLKHNTDMTYVQTNSFLLYF